MLKVELYQEPKKRINTIKELRDESIKGEMSEFEHSFLCGLIKEIKPSKLVEVGIAAGYTSTVIMECLSEVNATAEMYSVDLNELYYQDKSLPCGYIIDLAKKYFNFPIKHQKLLGKYLPEQLEKIGKEIDFLLLDTVHSLPGELLDFLAIFPYLKENAVVILHDISLNHLAKKDLYATKTLFDCVVADKYLMDDEKRLANFPNIAAFRINNDTKKYIGNIFLAMTTKWNYYPNKMELDLYMKWYEQFYEKDFTKMFRQAIILHQSTLEAEIIGTTGGKVLVTGFQEFLKHRKKQLFIYGCGRYGTAFSNYLQRNNIEYSGFVVSKAEKSGEIDPVYNKPIFDINKIPFASEECSILIAIGNYGVEIEGKLKQLGLYDYYPKQLNVTPMLYNYVELQQ